MSVADSPAPTRDHPWTGAAWYAALVVATVGFLTYNFRLTRADLTVPLCPLQNDSAALLSLVTAVQEAGWPWRVERLGAPGVAERYDYPLPEHVHYLAIRGLLELANDRFLAFNLWCLLSYPLTAVCAFAVGRALGVSRPMAFAVAGIYTFLPFHAGRVLSHTMLAYYHTVPLILLPTAWILVGRLPFFGPADAGGRRRFSPWNGTTAWTVLLAGVVAATSPYYAFFGCFFLLVAGLYRGLSDRSWRPLVAGSGVIAILVVVGLACALPFILEQREHGANPAVAQRHANEADVYALKVTDLVLPFSEHRLRSLGHVTRLYTKESLAVNESRDAVLGAVGTVGFILLFGRLLVARGGPTLLGGLAVLNVAAVVLASSGGLGGLFNYLVFPQMRCYNRVCVFIAFWSLLAIGLWVDRWATGGRPRRLWLAAGALLVFGVWDVTTVRQAPPHKELQARHHAWARFVARMEGALPPGGMVFQLPAVSYPEAGVTHQMPDYAHLGCHAFSKSVRWSYGTCRNRRWAEWHGHVADLPPAELVRALVLADFAGVYVDRRGYADHGERVVADLRSLLGPEVATSDAGDQLLFALAPIAPSLRSATTPAAWEGEQTRLLNRPCLLCQDGFFRWAAADPPGARHATHSACVRLINPGDRPRRVTVAMNWVRQGPGDKVVRLTGPTLGVDQQVPLPKAPEPFALDVDLPPGEHVLRFDTRPKPFGLPRMHAGWSATALRLVEHD